MNKKELDFILQEGEGLKLEFKESLNNLDKELVAFSNSEGGRIFLGVSDDGKIKGIKITNKIRSEIRDIANNIDPKIKIKLESFENILIIHVEEGKDKPYKCSSGFYLREGPNSQKLKRDEIVDLITQVGKIRFDEIINKGFNFPKDFDNKKFKEFLIRSNISEGTPIKDVLINLSLGKFLKKRFILNNTGILLFAKNPERFFRQNFVSCILFKGRERLNVIDKKDFNSDLLKNYEEGINFLKKHLKLSYIIKGVGPREERLELPEEALREALLNAIIHRDYFEDRFGIFIEIFDNRVEITNKGQLLFEKRKL